MQEKGISVVNQSLKTEYAQPNEMICNFFNCTADKRIFKLSKLKGEDSGDPIVYFESYFHPRIDIKQEDDFNTPLYSMLQENYGVVVHRSREKHQCLPGRYGHWEKTKSSIGISFTETRTIRL